MILSKTSEYALKVLSFMVTENRELYPAQLLHEKLNIPERYLRRLLTDLTKSGFIASTRGRYGGYFFAKPLDSIYLSDIIDAVEGFDSFNSCLLGVHQCTLENPCAMHRIWAETKEKILKTLTTTNLSDLRKTSISEL